ncbi:ROK family transcriptional regulator [Sinomicrobium soli]|uniref:ROK family transcriptional regulator n=1 Tax=Sinomicrobium sp. N-1-3-6 TaxID=2219864 RepID=UPI000DCD33C0|nr:ROK family transcriptional regulator [Sinomicrobium sp. N-1-3-6]RAV28433.1 ROK family transcriptional regulator [Sinomicrobium sp. N-1-3-6]
MTGDVYQDFFTELSDEHLSGVTYKNLLLKKKIVRYLDHKGKTTINHISKSLNISAPKTNALLQELIDIGLVKDYGKMETGVGRKPQLFGLISDSIYFLGVNVREHHVDVGLINFNEDLICIEKNIPYELENTESSLLRLCTLINTFIDRETAWKDKIVRIEINLSGRVNHQTGYSHNYFNFHDEPLNRIIRQKTGITTFIENDTRAKAFGEFHLNRIKNRDNILYVNADYGIGLGVMIDNNLHYGKSGYSGEFGHIPFFNNEIICRCGKKGCLETEASGRALVQSFREKLQSGSTSGLQHQYTLKDIKMSHIIEAALQDDMLAIELIGAIGAKLGKAVSTLIHLYNPELILFGGALASTGDHFFLPLQMSVNKYSINLVKNDTELKLSEFGDEAGVWGSCLLAKNRLLNT